MNKAIELGNMGIIELGAPPSLGGASALVQEKHAGLLAEGKKQAEKFGLKVATDAATNLPTGFASAMSSPTGVLASIGAAARRPTRRPPRTSTTRHRPATGSWCAML